MTTAAVLPLLLMLWASSASERLSAQRQPDQHGAPSCQATRGLSGFTVLTVDTLAHPRPVQSRGERSAVLAGALSFVVPGLGSFYAGNIGHGVRHLVAIPVVIGATVVGLELADRDGGEAESAEYAVLLGGAVLLLTNGIWGIVTAVNDAQDHNRSIGLGPFDLEPSVQVNGVVRVALGASLWF